MRIVTLSDTHGHHRKVSVPEGDVLIFAGDFMTSGYNFHEVGDFAQWFTSLPHPKKIWIAGNHDRAVESNKKACLPVFKGSVYLENDSTEYFGVKFYGSPITPAFNNWAFNVERGEAIKKYWDNIPDDTDVLITHGPPKGVLDNSIEWGPGLGCEELAKRVAEVRPTIHIFGHIHGGYGRSGEFRNVSICNEAYRPVNAPQVIDLKENPCL